MTIVLPEVDTIQHLEFDHTPPCESKACEGLGTAATHRYRAYPPCGHPVVKLYCTPHADQARGLMHLPAVICCETCHWNSIGCMCDWASLEPLS